MIEAKIAICVQTLLFCISMVVFENCNKTVRYTARREREREKNGCFPIGNCVGCIIIYGEEKKASMKKKTNAKIKN